MVCAPAAFSILVHMFVIVMRFVWASILIVFFTFSNSSAALLDYDQVLKKAVENAYDLKISKADIEIGKSAVKEAEALYFPTLNAKYNSEYVRDLTDGTPSVTTVGDLVLTPNTYYQDSIALSLQYNIFEFGITSKKVFIYRQDLDLKRIIHSRTHRDLKVKVLNLYTDLLLAGKELKTKEETLPLYKELLVIKERFSKAGLISRIDLVDSALRVVKWIDLIEGLKLKRNSTLHDLSFYTLEQYSPDEIEVADFKGGFNSKIDPIRYEDTPEYKQSEIEIEKKMAELEIAMRSNFPKLDFYSRYVWYGSDTENYDTAFTNLRKRNYLVGVAVTLPLFDGFRNNAQRQRLKQEIDKLKLEKERRVGEIRNKYEKLSAAMRIYDDQITIQKEMISQMETRDGMVDRLDRERITDRTVYLEQKIEMLTKKFELEKALITKTAALKEAEFLREATE